MLDQAETHEHTISYSSIVQFIGLQVLKYLRSLLLIPIVAFSFAMVLMIISPILFSVLSLWVSDLTSLTNYSFSISLNTSSNSFFEGWTKVAEAGSIKVFGAFSILFYFIVSVVSEFTKNRFKFTFKETLIIIVKIFTLGYFFSACVNFLLAMIIGFIPGGTPSPQDSIFIFIFLWIISIMMSSFFYSLYYFAGLIINFLGSWKPSHKLESS